MPPGCDTARAAREGDSTTTPLTLAPSFYDRPVLDVAADLIGCVVTHGETSGVIVETEAYHESEPACHGYAGLTPRTEVLFGEPGRAYVYRSYGIHALLNAVCEPRGVGAAVLIRALAPLTGIETMRERRGLVAQRPARDRDLCSGPGKLTQALGIDLELNGSSLLGDGPIELLPAADGDRPDALATGERIGITKAMELPWRFSDPRSRSVSRPWPPGMRVAR
jgi:DNA-3-methyladenine glycosylase